MIRFTGFVMSTVLFAWMIACVMINQTFGITISTNKAYTYKQMQLDLTELSKTHSLHSEPIGKTTYGRSIEAVRIGNGKQAILINAAHHGREWMSTMLVMKTIEEVAKRYQSDPKTKSKLDQIAVWFVPMVNPDGVTLQQEGVSAFPKSARKKLLSLNLGNKNFSRWKSNADGIDPNRQYPSDWEHIDTKKSPKPGYAYYRGTKPLQTAESIAMVNLFDQIKPLYTISYHTAGEVIYWHFHTPKTKTQSDQKMAQSFAKKTGYALMPKEYGHAGGGFNDWILTERNGSGVTIELGTGTGQVPISQFHRIWKQNKQNTWIALQHAFEISKNQKKG